MLRTLIGAAALTILLAGASNAQYNGGGSSGNTSGGDMQMNMMPDGRRHLTPEEAQREREIESRYNETVSDKIPDKKVVERPLGRHPLGAHRGVDRQATQIEFCRADTTKAPPPSPGGGARRNA